MPNLKSGFKRMQTSAENRDRNRAGRSLVGSMRAKFFAVVESGNKDEAMKLFREYCSVVDKTAKRGIIKANNASNKKAQASRKLASLAVPAAPAKAEAPKAK